MRGSSLGKLINLSGAVWGLGCKVIPLQHSRIRSYHPITSTYTREQPRRKQTANLRLARRIVASDKETTKIGREGIRDRNVAKSLEVVGRNKKRKTSNNDAVDGWGGERLWLHKEGEVAKQYERYVLSGLVWLLGKV